MSFDRGDWDKRLREREEQYRTEHQPEIRRQVQAAVAMESLTGSPEWDYFLSLVTQDRNELVGLREQAESILLGAEADDAAILRARIARAAAHGAIEALDRVMAMPADIIKNGQAAQKQVVNE